MLLEGKVAIVTGGGSGIGRATCLALAREGAAVVVSDVDSMSGEATAALVRKARGVARFVPADVGQSSECERLVREAVSAFGGLHILYNNAGIALPLEDGFTPAVSPEVWDRVLRVNLSGTFYCSHFAIPEMAKAGGGAIINAASSMALLPLGGLDAYAASKGGVAALTRSMAPGCAALGIRVNAICPGYVDTPMNAIIWQNEELKEAFARGHAMGLQTPEEVAEVVVFLASERGRSFTGAVLPCDRGWTAFKQPDMLRR
ncbi:MAG: short-chain dehydrogenase [Candidatus Binatia bacterium]|nr:MAG: short-chain dehydrogenase [Candidatus Binatia bacterium]